MVLSIGNGFYAADPGNEAVEVVITGSRRHAVIPGAPNVDDYIIGIADELQLARTQRRKPR